MRAAIENSLQTAITVLTSADPAEKTAAALSAETSLAARTVALPDRPARPDKPVLAAPGDVPKRKIGSPRGRAILLHAIAHIEFNAIDLAFDMAARFSGQIAGFGLDSEQFIADWVRIGQEEATHFRMIEARLASYNASYGDFPAHDGLWEAAEKTRHDVVARLVIAPMILEARGLDVTPAMATRLRSAGDFESADVLDTIYREEIGHVACGKHWFHEICKATNEDPGKLFGEMKTRYFAGDLKPPFNHEARSEAGLVRDWYEPATTAD